ncbi:MAG: hypothetical protein AAF570_24770, partial [Bacteroidota bacterium]
AITGGEMKKLGSFEHGDKKYIHATDRSSNQTASEYKHLSKEAKMLAGLKADGLDVPNVYDANPKGQAADTHTGVSHQPGSNPCIVMDYVDGTNIDFWKFSDQGIPKAEQHVEAVKAGGKALDEIPKVIKGLGKILNYLKTNIVVDLQVILEYKTGRAVIIDPQTVFPLRDKAAAAKYGAEHRTAVKSIENTKKHLEARNLELRESSWEAPKTPNQYPATNAKIGRKGVGTDRN